MSAVWAFQWSVACRLCNWVWEMFFVVMYKDHVVTQKMQAQRQIISLCPSPFTTLVRPHIVIGEIYLCMDCSCVQFNRLGACQTESLRLEIKKKKKTPFTRSARWDRGEKTAAMFRRRENQRLFFTNLKLALSFFSTSEYAIKTLLLRICFLTYCCYWGNVYINNFKNIVPLVLYYLLFRYIYYI